MLDWISFKDQDPTEKDMPFVCIDKYGAFSEVWDCVDWFAELDDKERAEWKHWLKFPKRPPFEPELAPNP